MQTPTLPAGGIHGHFVAMDHSIETMPFICAFGAGIVV